MAKKSLRRSIPQNAANPVRQVMQKAQDLDDRRQQQITNQIAAINRLAACLPDESAWSYTDEMGLLHQRLATVEAACSELIRTVVEHSQSHDQFDELHAAADKALAALQTSPASEPGRTEGALMGKRKDAFYAGFSAGETEDSVDESWAEYKASLEPVEDDAADDSDDSDDSDDDE